MTERDTLDDANDFVNSREKANLKRLEQVARKEVEHSDKCGCANCRRRMEKKVLDLVEERHRMRDIVPDEEEERIKNYERRHGKPKGK